MVTGFLIASVYAVGMLRGRRDRYHRLGFVDPVHGRGDRHADPALRRRHGGALDRRRPAGQVRRDGVHLQGRARPDRVPRRPSASTARSRAGSGSPGSTRSWSGFSKNTDVTGLNQIPKNDQPPAKTMLHLAFDSMVGIATAALPARRLVRHHLVAASGTCRPDANGSCAPRRWRGSRRWWRSECGWIVTEVGRQPWIVNGYMRTADAVTPAQGIWWVFGVTMALYAALGVITVLVLRGLSRRWREGRPEPRARSRTDPPAEATDRGHPHEQRGRLRGDPLDRGHALRDLRRRGLRRRRMGSARGVGRARASGSGPRSTVRSGPSGRPTTSG